MSLRKRACIACARAKQRCDQGHPTCRRCKEKSLLCQVARPSKHARVITHESVISSSTNPLINTEDVTCFANEPFLNFSSVDYEYQPNVLQQSIGNHERSIDDLCVQDIVQEIASSSGIGRFDESYNSHVMQQSLSPCADRGAQGPLTQSSPAASLTLLTPGLFPRALETNTWNFCGSELLSYVKSFAQTATAPFIVPAKSHHADRLLFLHPYLRSALGVCAFYETSRNIDKQLCEQLLALEMGQLNMQTDSSFHLQIDNADVETGHHVFLFREALARLQAITFYQIIRYFSHDPQQRRLAEQQEPMVSAWTASLQHQLQSLCQQRITNSTFAGTCASFASVPENNWIFDEADVVSQEEIDSAYRVILMSYFIRSIYTIVYYRVCPLLVQMSSLTVYTLPTIVRDESDRLTSGSSPLPLSYKEIADMWDDREAAQVGPDDRFLKLLRIACHGKW